MAIVSSSTIEEEKYILIVTESIRLITEDCVIKTSLKGPEAIRLLASVQESVARGVFYRSLVSALMSCFLGAPSGQLDAVWGEFHKARLSEKLHASWQKITPSTPLEQGTIAFQLLITFCMKVLI